MSDEIPDYVPDYIACTADGCGQAGRPKWNPGHYPPDDVFCGECGARCARCDTPDPDPHAPGRAG